MQGDRANSKAADHVAGQADGHAVAEANVSVNQTPRLDPTPAPAPSPAPASFANEESGVERPQSCRDSSPETMKPRITDFFPSASGAGSAARVSTSALPGVRRKADDKNFSRCEKADAADSEVAGRNSEEILANLKAKAPFHVVELHQSGYVVWSSDIEPIQDRQQIPSIRVEAHQLKLSKDSTNVIVHLHGRGSGQPPTIDKFCLLEHFEDKKRLLISWHREFQDRLKSEGSESILNLRVPLTPWRAWTKPEISVLPEQTQTDKVQLRLEPRDGKSQEPNDNKAKKKNWWRDYAAFCKEHPPGHESHFELKHIDEFEARIKLMLQEDRAHVGLVAYLHMHANTDLEKHPIVMLPSESEIFKQCMKMFSRKASNSQLCNRLKDLYDEVFTQRHFSCTESFKIAASDIAAEFKAFVSGQPHVEAEANVFTVPEWFFHIKGQGQFYFLEWLYDFFGFDSSAVRLGNLVSQSEFLVKRLVKRKKLKEMRLSVQRFDDSHVLQEERSQFLSMIENAESVEDYDENALLHIERDMESLLRQEQKRHQDEKDVSNITNDIRSLSNRVKLSLQSMLKDVDRSTSCEQDDNLIIREKALQKITVDLQAALQRLAQSNRSSQLRTSNSEGDFAKMLKKVKKSLAKANIEFKRVEGSSLSDPKSILSIANWYELDQMKLDYKRMGQSLEEFAVAHTGADLSGTCDDRCRRGCCCALWKDIREGLSGIRQLSESEDDPTNISQQIKFKQSEKDALFKNIDEFVRKAPPQSEVHQYKQGIVDAGADDVHERCRMLQFKSDLGDFVSLITSTDSSQNLDLEHIRTLAQDLLHALKPIQPLSESQMSQTGFDESPDTSDNQQLSWIRFALKQRKALMFVIGSLVRQEARDVLFPDSFTKDERIDASVQSVTYFNAADLQFPEVEERLKAKVNQKWDRSKVTAKDFLDQRMLAATSIDPRRGGIHEFVGLDIKSSEASLQEAYSRKWKCLKAKKIAKKLGMPTAAKHKYTDYFNVPPVLTQPPNTADPDKLEIALNEAITEFEDRNDIKIFIPKTGRRNIRQMWEALEYAYGLFPFSAPSQPKRDAVLWESAIVEKKSSVAAEPNSAPTEFWWQRPGYSGMEPFPHEFAVKETVHQHPQFWIFDRIRQISKGEELLFPSLDEKTIQISGREPVRPKTTQKNKAEPSTIDEYCWFSSQMIFEAIEKKDWPTHLNGAVYELYFPPINSSTKSKQQIDIDLSPLAQVFKCDYYGNVISKHLLQFSSFPKHGLRDQYSITAFAVDHIFPWVCGGLTVTQNLQALHHFANKDKNSSLWKPASELAYGLTSLALMEMYIYLHWLVLYRTSTEDQDDRYFDLQVGMHSQDPRFDTLNRYDISDKEEEEGSGRRARWALERLEHILCVRPPENFETAEFRHNLYLAKHTAEVKMNKKMAPREATKMTLFTIRKGREYYRTILYLIYPHLAPSNPSDHASYLPYYPNVIASAMRLRSSDT